MHMYMRLHDADKTSGIVLNDFLTASLLGRFWRSCCLASSQHVYCPLQHVRPVCLYQSGPMHSRSMGTHCDKVILIAALDQVFASRLQKSVQDALFRGVELGSHKPPDNGIPRSAEDRSKA